MKRFIGILILYSILGEANAQTDTDELENRNDEVYIVYMGSTSNSKEGVPRTDHVQLLNKHVERKNNSVVQIYNASFLGLALRLSPEEATEISERPGVVSVFSDSLLKLHTTRSWDFLMSQSPFSDSACTSTHSNVSDRSKGGHRDTIIGILDTGIWPNHPSFNDEFMGPIPKRWKGTCMTDNNNLTTPSFTCNRKVIGARYYDDHYYPVSITTAMDGDGHGTHVASIAAGIPIIHGASYYGLAKGVARGGSPYSRIAVYRVCGTKGCAVSSILKAFDDAIADGVDVISVSLGGASDRFFTDSVAIGAFHAMENGVIVVAAAGNEGPSFGTVVNYSPWILTVGATTIDRDFEMDIVLGGPKEMIIKGGGINFSGLNKSPVYQLVDGRSAGHNQSDSFNATHCVPGSLDGAKVKGRIVLCMSHDRVDIFDKIDAMKEQGVIGIIMISDSLRQLTYNFQTSIVFAAVTTADGAQIQSYMNSTKNPLATILPTQTILNYKPAPEVADFSSRGPTPGITNFLKPDVSAPGVSILAAWRFNDTIETFPGKMEPPLFNLLSGTSMSCPHISGVAATVKSWYPKSTPSAIKSAIMTTAIQNNNLNAPITNLLGSRATPYDIGAGEISIFGPLYPGLVYETETIDYILFLCNLGYNNTAIKILSSTVPDNFSCPRNSSPDLISDMNYPSIAVSGLRPNLKKTVKRTVTNVGRVNSNYRVTVEAPAGVDVKVVPNTMQFTKHVKKRSFQVTFKLTTTSLHEDVFGSITWSSDQNFYNVRSPIVVSKA